MNLENISQEAYNILSVAAIEAPVDAYQQFSIVESETTDTIYAKPEQLEFLATSLSLENYIPSLQ